MCTLCARAHFATFSRLDTRSMDVKFLVVVTMVTSVLMRGTAASRPAPMRDDDDTKDDMMADIYEKLESFEFTMTNATSGEPIAGAGAIVVPTFSGSMVDVGVFLPESYMGTRSSDENEFRRRGVCNSNPAACANEEPYPGAPADYVCGLSDESREETDSIATRSKCAWNRTGICPLRLKSRRTTTTTSIKDAARPPVPRRARARAGTDATKITREPEVWSYESTRSRTLRTAGARGFGPDAGLPGGDIAKPFSRPSMMTRRPFHSTACTFCFDVMLHSFQEKGSVLRDDGPSRHAIAKLIQQLSAGAVTANRERFSFRSVTEPCDACERARFVRDVVTFCRDENHAPV